MDTSSQQTASGAVAAAVPAPASDATTRIREIFGRVRLPNFDVEAFIEARQADIDAMSHATTIAFSGAQTITQKQAELLKSTLEEINTAIKSRTSPEQVDTSEVTRKKGDLIRSTLSLTIEGMKDMAEAAQKSQSEISDIVLDRARSNAEELRALFVRKPG